MLKKFVSLVVGVSLALATIGVAAENPKVETKSVYDAGSKTLTVVTTVTNPEEGSTYTYMAYDNSVTTVADLSEGTIKYVDQKLYDGSGTNLAFEFETTTNNASKLFNDIIKVGGKTFAGDAYEAATSGVGTNEAGPAVTVDGVAVEAEYQNYISLDVADTDFVKITIANLGNVKSVTYTGAGSDFEYFYGSDCIWMKKADILAADKADDTIVVETETEVVEARTLDIGYIKNDDILDEEGGVDPAPPAVIAVGQVQGKVRSYGIVFAKTADFKDPVALIAQGRSENGKYAIKIRNFKEFEGFADATEIYAMAYYITTSGQDLYGAPFVVPVNGEDAWVNGSKVQK